MRPSYPLQAQFERALSSTGLGAALTAPSATPVLGLHVRHGDACGRDRFRTRRVCDPLSTYMAAVRRVSAGLNVRTIFLATDRCVRHV